MPRLLLLAVFAPFVFGCAQFQGLGPIQTASYRSPSSPPSPTSVRQGPKGRFTLTWPVSAVRLNQPFRPNKKRRPHLGLDLGGKKGTPILAAHEGTVIYAGRAFKTFGKMVIVEFDNEWATIYAHLDRIHVKNGQSVGQGEQVGTMGRTGRATGVHLHFEVLHFRRPVDPMPLLNQYEQMIGTR